MAGLLLPHCSARRFVEAITLFGPVAPTEVLTGSGPEGLLVRRKRTILCIDDNPDWLFGLKTLLGEEYEVLLASSGREGLELYSAQPLDAVIIDYQMPEMTGDRIAIQMKRAKHNVPIVLLSAYDSLPENVLQTVDAFVTKRETPVALPVKVRDLLAVHSPFFTRRLKNWRRTTQVSKIPSQATRLHGEDHSWSQRIVLRCIGYFVFVEENRCARAQGLTEGGKGYASRNGKTVNS